jgi:hexokinase
MDTKAYIEGIKTEFELGREELGAIAARFRKAMEEGLAGRPSPLKMLPSYIGEPSGMEEGSTLAVDFGGTNVRVIKVSLSGSGRATIEEMRKFPLKAPDGSYDHVSPQADAAELFDCIAEKIAEIAPRGKPLPLGHTFSFPCDQRGINSAFLINWTKEIRTRGVEGRDVTLLLEAALARKGVKQAVPAAVINDTVGTLLAAGYSERHVDVASICGTGHNSCYLEPKHPLTGKPMIVNMESGNFDGAPQTRIDRELDSGSEMPGGQKLEKMVSGHYLGEIFRMALKRAAEDGIIPASPALSQKFSVGTADMDPITKDSLSLSATDAFLSSKLALNGLSKERLGAVKAMNDAIVRRSARLVGASFAGTILYVDPGLSRPHTIAIDGSLYEKMPGFHDGIAQALLEVLGKEAKVKTILAKDGSGIGAAIAAAVAVAGRP